MLISYNWLKEYIDIKIPPEKLCELLTMAGLSVASIHKKANDHIIEIEVTSNRPDCLNMIGVAREVAAITGRRLKLPAAGRQTPVKKDKNQETVVIRIEDKKLCPRYTARIIRDVKIEESPSWLKTRVDSVGLRPVNNIVDITNFCLIEAGEPMHAFDLDKISGSIIIVRKAKKGEKIITIDGIERTLEDSDLVIADDTRPIAIAGVMGGLATEVTASTRNILLEAAYFNPISVRRASRRLGLSTESSYRFERKVDIENIIPSSNRSACLISKLAGGRICSLSDIGEKPTGHNTIWLRFAKLSHVLGIEIPASKVKNILKNLGLKIKSGTSAKVKLEAPSYRQDLRDEVDIIEEVSRIYGYDKIPSTLPCIVAQPVIKTRDMLAEDRIRQILTGLGCDEIITYSLLSKKVVGMTGLPDKNVVEIKNPLTSEQEAMRPSLLAGMLDAVMWNINRKTKDLRLFELGKIYAKGPDGSFSEKRHISIGLTGSICSGWIGPTRLSSFFDLTGVLGTLLSELGITSFDLTGARDETFSASACATIRINGQTVGLAGEVSPKILNNFDIKEKVYALELDMEAVLQHVSLENRFKELPRYPSISRDLSIIVGKDISNAEAVSLIKTTGGPLLKDVKLIDRYIGPQIPDGKVGLTYRLEYQDQSRTLEEKDVSVFHSKILEELNTKVGARLR